MQYFFQLLLQYKWTLGLGLFMFIFCLMILNFGIGITFLVLLFTVVAGLVGFLRDRDIKLSELIRNIK